jgi:hypothetical protein
MAFPFNEKGKDGPRPLPSLSARSAQPEEADEVEAVMEDIGETEEEEAPQVGAPGPVTMDMLGFITEDSRCGNCLHMSKDGMCAWTQTEVGPGDGCIFGFAEKQVEDDVEIEEAA